MSLTQRLELVLLGAIWGASFLFMRVAAPELGPVALIGIRVAIAAVFLTALMAWRGELAQLSGHTRSLTVLGVVNSALPFTLFAYAALSLPAGFSSVLNATTPLFGAVVGFLVLRERVASSRVLGLVLGFSGVVILVWSKLGVAGDNLAVLAGLAAGLCYGVASHFAKRKLSGVAPLAISAGSQVAAAAALAPLAIYFWPSESPSLAALGCALALGVVCTALAYLLYFRLLARVGPTRAMTVTYLIPVFGMVWGALFLSEPISLQMLIGAVVILVGTTIVARGHKSERTPNQNASYRDARAS